ncbi:hypothetical protein EXE30_04355 [Acinetobacter halotolerans]|uniref:Uncharacterized protein n=1 Tax=Acinetobacter halotolerans TaxID=1752076 RepID=A0A4Q6XJK6_9GAMM|nr:hypothetical protein [Acinetobacter halotolerans]RZF54458.1 hypothetical protein EXE30_04355 [Acinetobacter halotolerans]
MTYIPPHLFSMICRVAANRAYYFEFDDWRLKLRNALFEQGAMAELNMGFDTEILFTEDPKQNLCKYQLFKYTDCLIQSLQEIENLSNWRFFGIDCINEYETKFLKIASLDMVHNFEKPEFFPQNKTKIIEMINILLTNKYGYELRSIDEKYIKLDQKQGLFYCPDDKSEVNWYDLTCMIISPEAKQIIPQNMLEEFECTELNYQLNINFL